MQRRYVMRRRQGRSGRKGLRRWDRLRRGGIGCAVGASSEGYHAVGVHKGEHLVVDAADDAGASVYEGG